MEFLLVFACALALAWGAERLWRSAATRPEPGRRWWTVTASSALAGYLIGYFLMALGFLVAAGNFDVSRELGLSDRSVVAWICAGSAFFAGLAAGYAGVGRFVAELFAAAVAGVTGGIVLLVNESLEPTLVEIVASAASSIVTSVAMASWLRHRLPKHTEGAIGSRHLPAH